MKGTINKLSLLFDIKHLSLIYWAEMGLLSPEYVVGVRAFPWVTANDITQTEEFNQKMTSVE